jgi:hypothetical protein
MTRRIALGCMAQPPENRRVLSSVASDEASFVAGAVLFADGGGGAPV